MKQHLRTINLSDPVEYLTPPGTAVHALNLGYRDRQPEETKSGQIRLRKKRKKEGER